MACSCRFTAAGDGLAGVGSMTRHTAVAFQTAPCGRQSDTNVTDEHTSVRSMGVALEGGTHAALQNAIVASFARRPSAFVIINLRLKSTPSSMLLTRNKRLRTALIRTGFINNFHAPAILNGGHENLLVLNTRSQ